jgi:hypothetical protein
MRHLGDFGTPRPQADFTFGYFGATLRVNPDLSDVAVMDLFAEMGDAGEDPAKGMGALRAVAATLVHPDDVDELWRLVKTNRQTIEDVGTLAAKLIEAVTDRPTLQPSDSSAGLSNTDTSSTDDSSSRALRALRGRPDLQVAVLQAHEAHG